MYCILMAGLNYNETRVLIKAKLLDFARLFKVIDFVLFSRSVVTKWAQHSQVLKSGLKPRKNKNPDYIFFYALYKVYIKVLFHTKHVYILA